jgi:hypothetical protein
MAFGEGSGLSHNRMFSENSPLVESTVIGLEHRVVRREPKFRRNPSPPSPGSKNKPGKQTAEGDAKWADLLLGLLTDPEHGGDMRSEHRDLAELQSATTQKIVYFTATAVTNFNSRI